MYIVIKFIYLTDIYLAINWWKLQQNMPGHFLEIQVFLGGCFIMPHPVYDLLNDVTDGDLEGRYYWNPFRATDT